MTEHRIATQQQWQSERDELLKEEKELTRRGDELDPQAARAPVGTGREGVPVRDGARDEDACRAVRRPLPAARVPLHVRTGLRHRLPGLLLDHGHARPPGPAPEGPGHDAPARLPRPARQAPRIPGEDGLAHRVGLERRQRLQPGPRLSEHRERSCNRSSRARFRPPSS